LQTASRRGYDNKVASADRELRLESQAVLAEIAARMFPRASVPWLDRFRVVRLIGRGAFGCVVEAEDVRLDRRVAVKVVRAQPSGASAEASSRRLIREARVLARLDHPNVVRILDVGRQNDEVWLAMELVRGASLREWMQAHAPGGATARRDALEVLSAAGRGLAAAHAVGILHRDFKPANVLVGEPTRAGRSFGRVCVADFGLARPTTAPSPDGQPLGRPTAGAPSTAESSSTHTRIGTPRYMSPEQLHGRSLDARSDQFNFAVTAWEVLFGATPFAGDTREAVLAAIDAHAIDAPRVRGVPAAVVRALRRALSRDPTDRFPSMDALLHAIEPRGNARAIWLVATGCFAAAMLPLWIAAGRNDDRPRCDDSSARAELDPVIGDERRMAVADAIARSGSLHAAPTRDTVDASLSAFASRWIDAHVSACRATWHDGESEQLLDARMACLRDGLHTADALLDRFREPTPALVDRAVEAVGALPSPERCASPDDATTPSPLEIELRRRAAEARAAALATAHETALGIAVGVAEQARAAGLDDILGDALQIQGQVQVVAHDEAATDVLRQSYELAIAAGDDRRAALRARELARASASARRYPEAREWLRHAEASGQRVSESVEEQLDQAVAECWVFHDAGSDAEALVACTRGVELAADERVPTMQRQLVTRLLALLYMPLGRHDEAEALLRELLARNTAEFGATHPATRIIVWNLADIAAARDDAAEAIRLLREFHATTEAVGGVSTAYILSRSYAELGSRHVDVGDYDAANAAFDRALGHLATWAPTRMAAGEIEGCNIRRRRAEMWLAQGEHGRAKTELREIAEVEHRLLSPNHFDTWATVTVLAYVLLETGEPAAAEAELAKLVPELRKAEHYRLPHALTYYGWAAEQQDHLGDAQDRYREAVAAAGLGSGYAMGAMGRLVDVTLQGGDSRNARRLLDEVTAAPRTEEWSDRSPEAALALARAVVLDAEGDDAGADAGAREARELLADERSRFRFDTFDVLLERRLDRWEAGRIRSR
jgi:serine/threonine protein kinase/tetratricopeptide (TPR) repeat protein